MIADLDGDGRAEVVVPVNTFARALVGCPESVTPGIKVLSEKNGQWANARPVWNQHAYHLTNVCDGEDAVCGGPLTATNLAGAIPQPEPQSWNFTGDSRDPGPYNSYRLQVGSRYDAPNLALSPLSVDERRCPSELTLKVRVENRGVRTAPAGVLVEFLIDGASVAAARTTSRLVLGSFEIVSTVWKPSATQSWPATIGARVNDDHLSRECRSDDNRSPSVSILCR